MRPGSGETWGHFAVSSRHACTRARERMNRPTLPKSPPPYDWKGYSAHLPAARIGAVLVSVIIFDQEAQDALARLHKGDAASITGRATLKSWTGKDGELRTGLSVVAERVISAYQARKQRPPATKGNDLVEQA